MLSKDCYTESHCLRQHKVVSSISLDDIQNIFELDDRVASIYVSLQSLCNNVDGEPPDPVGTCVDPT